MIKAHYRLTLSNPRGRMVPVPAQIAALKRMRMLRARGLSYRAIGEKLLREGHVPARARAWSIRVVRNLILRQPA